MSTRVFVSVGTDHHPFTRLIDWVDDWEAGRDDVHLIVQHGASRPSLHGTNFELLGGEEIAAEYDAADLVISQVGPGTIADANRSGHRPIVVPRDPALGEVVDDHQVAFGEFMAARGRCLCVRSPERLLSAIETSLDSPTGWSFSDVALSSSTASDVAELARTVISSPTRHFSFGRLVTSLRRPSRQPSTSTT